MLWHAQHGATAEKYRQTCIDRGAPIPAYLNPPEPLPGITPWFMAFWELSTDRRFPGGPIPRATLMAFPVAPDEADEFRDAMRACDAEYIAYLDKPADERKSLPPAPSGLFKGRGKK